MKNKINLLTATISLVILIVTPSLYSNASLQLGIIGLKLPREMFDELMRAEDKGKEALNQLYSLDLNNDFFASIHVRSLRNSLGMIEYLNSPTSYSGIDGTLSNEDMIDLRHAFYDTMQETSECIAKICIHEVPYKKMSLVLKRQANLCAMLGSDCDKTDLSLRKIAHDRLRKQINTLEESNQNESGYLEKEQKAAEQRILQRKQEQQELSKIIQEIE